MAHEIVPGPDTRLFHPGFAGHNQISGRTFGFWLYMLSDALLFASLFAAYAVLDTPMSAAGGPTAAQIVDLPEGFYQTIILVASVTAYSFATVAMKKNNRLGANIAIVIAMLLGAAFIALGLTDLAVLSSKGDGITRSGYLSIYFIFILTHIIHMLFGMLWMLVMIVQVTRSGFSEMVVARLLNLRMFWQFQVSVWICIYIYVYMIGA